MLKVTVLPGPEALLTLRAEWEALDECLVPRMPFTGPLWHELWWRYYRRHSVVVRDEFLVCTVRDEEGRLVGVAPLMRTHHPGVGPFRLREIQFFGADPNMTELRGVACRPECQMEVLQSLSRYFGSNALGWNWFRWQGIRADVPPPPIRSRTGGDFTWLREVPDYILDLPSTWEEFDKACTSRVRKKLRSCYRLLERNGHAFRFHIVSDPSSVADALAAFYSLHTERTAVRSSDVFASSRARKFLDEFCRFMADRDQLRIFEIKIQDVVVATRIGFKLGKELYLYHSGNAIAWDRYSIMTTLLAETIKSAIEQGYTLVNLSTGNDRSKTRWRPREVKFVDGVEIAPGIVNAYLFAAFESIRNRLDRGVSWPFRTNGSIDGFGESRIGTAVETTEDID